MQRGRREQSRLRVRLPVRLETRSVTCRAILIDLSSSGARLALENLPRVGTEALILWDKYEAFGEVVWAEGVQCGIAFFDPLPGDVVLKTRELDDAAHLPQDKELLRQVARQWVEGTTRL
ncbi:conserved hypothetical protein [Novosphingobium sp. PP1Y]|nr:PilZ domain-containing protein [Novosphingobium sp. PP1Y]CCA94060.1 conserved hypothetical protein [Novosphingobium sp. PP1Y]